MANFESNTFACKTFACGSLANNQQTHPFFTISSSITPETYITPNNAVYPVNFNVVYSSPWQAIVNDTTSIFLNGRLMEGENPAGFTVFLQKKNLTEHSNSNAILNSLVTFGRSTSTEIVLGMGISGITTNISQPKAYNARLMKEPK